MLDMVYFISAGKTYKPAHKRTASYPHHVLWNASHGPFYWVDDLAYDVCRKLYDEFDIADVEGIKEAILAALPNAKLKHSPTDISPMDAAPSVGCESARKASQNP